MKRKGKQSSWRNNSKSSLKLSSSYSKFSSQEKIVEKNSRIRVNRRSLFYEKKEQSTISDWSSEYGEKISEDKIKLKSKLKLN